MEKNTTTPKDHVLQKATDSDTSVQAIDGEDFAATDIPRDEYGKITGASQEIKAEKADEEAYEKGITSGGLDLNPSTTETRKNVNADPNLIQGNHLTEESN